MLRNLSTSTNLLRFLVDFVTSIQVTVSAEKQLPRVYFSSVKVFICEWKSDSSAEEDL